MAADRDALDETIHHVVMLVIFQGSKKISAATPILMKSATLALRHSIFEMYEIDPFKGLFNTVGKGVYWRVGCWGDKMPCSLLAQHIVCWISALGFFSNKCSSLSLTNVPR